MSQLPSARCVLSSLMKSCGWNLPLLVFLIEPLSPDSRRAPGHGQAGTSDDLRTARRDLHRAGRRLFVLTPPLRFDPQVSPHSSRKSKKNYFRPLGCPEEAGGVREHPPSMIWGMGVGLMIVD